MRKIQIWLMRFGGLFRKERHDGEFAAEIIALGESDARARSDELCELFEDAVR